MSNSFQNIIPPNIGNLCLQQETSMHPFIQQTFYLVFYICQTLNCAENKFMSRTQGDLQSNKGRQLCRQLCVHNGGGKCMNEVSSLGKANLSTSQSFIHLCIYHVLILTTYQAVGLALSIRDTEFSEIQPLLSRNPLLNVGAR